MTEVVSTPAPASCSVRRTPVHSHETWGVAGIYSGAERETRYLKPAACARPAGPLGTLRRRSYDPVTGEARWFVSGWDADDVARCASGRP